MMHKFVLFSISCLTLISYCCGVPFYPRIESFDSTIQRSKYDDDDDVDARNILSQDDLNKAEEEDAMLYEVFLQNLLDELEEEEEKKLDLEDEDIVSLDQGSLDELKELESILDKEMNEEDENNVDSWMEDASLIGENLPPNYHNRTVIHRKIGQNNVEVKESIDKSTDNNKQSIKISNVFESYPTNIDPNFECTLSQPCNDDQYCYKTSTRSKCFGCHEVGSSCIDDAQCCSDDQGLSLCVEGSCRTGISPGSVGTICDELDDCQAGLCCAATSGYPRRICKPLAKLNQQCSTAVSLAAGVVVIGPNDHFCPCETGLSCINQNLMPYEKNPSISDEDYICKKVPKNLIDQDGRLKASNFRSEIELLNAKSDNDLIEPRWQTRVESEDDQRFVNPSVNQRHASYKKSWEPQAEADLIM